MSNAYLQGIQTAFDNQAEIRNNIYVVASNWFVNRCPLVTRVPRVPVGSTTFTMLMRDREQLHEVTLTQSVNATDREIRLSSVHSLTNGDVLETAYGERIEVLANPDFVDNTIVVRRGAEGTTPTFNRTGDTLVLIGNSRGAFRVVGVSQHCQTWQHPVHQGTKPSDSFDTANGLHLPFDQYKMEALQNLMDDMEYSSYYGRGEDPSIAGRPKQKGLRTLLTTNMVVNPINGNAYKKSDFIRDTLQQCRTNGGEPDVLLVSSNFMRIFEVWEQELERIDAGVNVFGTPIDLFTAPFLASVSIIEAPMLRDYTAVCLSSGEVRMRMKRNEFWNPRGVRGDAYEGDWIAEGAIEVDDQAHHAWVEGITAFCAD